LTIFSLAWLAGGIPLEEEFIFSGASLGDSKSPLDPVKLFTKPPEVVELPIFFSEADEAFLFSGTSSTDLKQRECWQSGQLFWNATQKCYVAATRGPCGASEWIILTGDPSVAASVECQSMPCPSGHVLLQNGRCHSFNNKSQNICHLKEQVLAINPYGRSECVCRSDPFYVQWKDRCYPLFRKGPCASGEYLMLENNIAVCVSNPCKLDGLVTFNGSCSKLDSEEPCTGSEVLKVDGNSLELKCQLEVRQISIVPYRCGTKSHLAHSSFCRPKWSF